jgi:hypothetical protein
MFVDGINARCRNAAINTATGNKWAALGERNYSLVNRIKWRVWHGNRKCLQNVTMDSPRIDGTWRKIRLTTHFVTKKISQSARLQCKNVLQYSAARQQNCLPWIRVWVFSWYFNVQLYVKCYMEQIFRVAQNLFTIPYLREKVWK